MSIRKGRATTRSLPIFSWGALKMTKRRIPWNRTRLYEELQMGQSQGIEAPTQLVFLPNLSGVSFVTKWIGQSEFGMLEEPCDTPRRRSTMEGGDAHDPRPTPTVRQEQQMADSAPWGFHVVAGQGQEHPGVAAGTSRACLVLRPKGKYRVPRSRSLRSRHGFSSCRLNWHVVELWTIPAEELLRAGDVGLIPWVPLTDFADPPETMLQRCRETIEEHAPPGEKANLLVVTQVFSFLRYNDLGLLTILGGKDVMLEVPFLDEIVMEKTRETARKTAQQDVATVLEARFGDVPGDVVEGIESIDDETQLRSLVRLAASCPDLAAFRDAAAQN
jgi:hypothetical protein